MKILHISPTYFSDQSVMAGAERYAYELAKAMSKRASVVFLSFARNPSARSDAALRVEHVRRGVHGWGRCANPFSFRFLKWVLWADVIHCHQAHMMSTEVALIVGAAFLKKVFITDLGGCGRYSLSRCFPIMKLAHGFLLISEFSKQRWIQGPWKDQPRRVRIIYGGVDPLRFSPGPQPKRSRILYVGRIVPARNIHHLIDALPSGSGLDVAGVVYDEGYYRQLQEAARGKDVVFYPNLSDEALVELYQTACATILPIAVDGGFTTALESLSCGTPVIATAAGSLPEIVEDGLTGFLVPPGDLSALREKITYLLSNLPVSSEMGRQGRQTILRRFTWDSISEDCLRAYKTEGVA